LVIERRRHICIEKDFTKNFRTLFNKEIPEFLGSHLLYDKDSELDDLVLNCKYLMGEYDLIDSSDDENQKDLTFSPPKRRKRTMKTIQSAKNRSSSVKERYFLKRLSSNFKERDSVFSKGNLIDQVNNICEDVHSEDGFDVSGQTRRSFDCKNKKRLLPFSPDNSHYFVRRDKTNTDSKLDKMLELDPMNASMNAINLLVARSTNTAKII